MAPTETRRSSKRFEGGTGTCPGRSFVTGASIILDGTLTELVRTDPKGVWQATVFSDWLI